MEVYLIGGKPVDGVFKGECYNTTTFNTVAGSRDSCPQALMEKLNPKKLAEEYQAGFVFLNPPRQWLLDWIDIPYGKVRDFGGLKAAWCAVADIPASVLRGGKRPPAYNPLKIARKSKFGFNKGATVHVLDDPEGNTWIQKSLTQSVSRENTLKSFGKIGSRLKLPQGWKSRMKVLEEELILIPETGVATILSDDLFDMYDLTGKGYSTYKP
jgi:hypothetical protein